MPLRPQYPNATSRRNHYSDLVASLEANRRTIENSINNAAMVDLASFDPQSVDGEYYNRYLTKCDDWNKLHRRTISAFETFLANLETCITAARNQEMLWGGRIGMMEEDN